MDSLSIVRKRVARFMRELGLEAFETELVQRERFKRRDDARLAVFSYIEGFYNPLRRHSALDYRSPAEYERMLAEN